ncbi:MAG: VOC family protein [Desulfobacterales bacterium]|nr:MAG: VOC family protein [Desulfobacterales bacterium]
MTYGFHHVHLICKDLEEMINFFADVIGARLVARQKFGTADGASFDLQGVTVNLRVAREDEEMHGDASQARYGFDHIGLQVDDIEAAYQDLTRRGFAFSVAPREFRDLKIAFFKGPEDITIELLQTMN